MYKNVFRFQRENKGHWAELIYKKQAFVGNLRKLLQNAQMLILLRVKYVSICHRTPFRP